MLCHVSKLFQKVVCVSFEVLIKTSRSAKMEVNSSTSTVSTWNINAVRKRRRLQNKQNNGENIPGFKKKKSEWDPKDTSAQTDLLMQMTIFLCRVWKDLWRLTVPHSTEMNHKIHDLRESWLTRAKCYILHHSWFVKPGDKKANILLRF